VSDYQMRELTGLDVLKKIREAGNTTPFIIFTGKGREEVVIEALNLGADYYLQKGGDFMSLFTELLNIIEKEAERKRELKKRKKMEEELRESEELFSQFMDQLPAAAFIKDKESRTLFANKYAKEVCGGDQWIGKTAMELFPAETARKMIADDQKALTEGLQIITEELRDVNNVLNIYQTYKFPIKRKAKPNLLGGIAVDITERLQREEKIRESEEKYRFLVENSLQGILIFQDDQFRFANQTFAEISGFSVEEILTLPTEHIFSAIHPEDYQYVMEIVQKRLEGDSTPRHYEFRLLRKDGVIRWVEIFSLLIDYHGKPAIQAVFLDISERKKRKKVRLKKGTI
ncbi:MAG: PAS domain S-box protein, partial [Candidatus Hodarchaeota archaeon]